LSAPGADGEVIAVALGEAHRFSKRRIDVIRLVEGRGVEGDAHYGDTVQHRSRVAVDPDQPNLRQVHLIQVELLDELLGKGFAVAPAELGENVTTRGIDLLGLPQGTRLRLGEAAMIELTGLRNPCAQIEAFKPGLLAAVLDKGPDGEVIRKCGVMAVVLASGPVQPGDRIAIELPAEPHHALERI